MDPLIGRIYGSARSMRSNFLLMTKEQISDLFESHHHLPRKETVPELVNEARQMLREKYFSAEVGITGGNFLVAETGSSVIVTNEGNGDLTQTLAKVHIVTSGIERVIPTLDDVSVFLRRITSYNVCYTKLLRAGPFVKGLIQHGWRVELGRRGICT